MKKSEFLSQAQKINKPTYYGTREITEFIELFSGCAIMWNENNTDPEEYDRKYFFTEAEAEEYARKIDLEVGFSAIVEKNTFETKDFLDQFGFNDNEDFWDDFDLEEVWNELNDYCEVIDTIDTNEGRNIEHDIIIEWSWEKYPGYARNFLNISYGNAWPFYFENESDLITGNEDSTFKSNYSILLTGEETEGLTDSEIYSLVEDRLFSGSWKWNYFKNRPTEDKIIKGLSLNIED